MRASANCGHRSPLAATTIVFIAIVALSAPAFGQYLYLDADGDGVHTPGDVLSPSGITRLDLWLRTDANRDGSPTTCSTGHIALTIRGYEFILHATNGTVVWGAYSNLVASMSVASGVESNATDYHNGYSGGAELAPGAYKLGSLVVSVASGTPTLAFATATPLSGIDVTAFGSGCYGTDFDNVMKLGTDWSDADGAAFGGASNRAPLLEQPADMTVAEGAVAEEALAATDPEAQALAFSLVSGPAYADVTTTVPGTGLSVGLLRLAPGYSAAGSTSASVRVSDGFLVDEKSLAIVVTDTNRAPVLPNPLDMMAPEGTTSLQFVGALDPDADVLTYRKANGPDYMTVTTVNSGESNQARIQIAPGFTDAADMVMASVAVTDGVLGDEKMFRIMVRNVNRPPVLAVTLEQTVAEGDRVRFDVTVSDPDNEISALTAIDLPAGATFTDQQNNTGSFDWVPNFQQAGVYSVTITARDPYNATDSNIVVMTVTTPVRPVVLLQPQDMTATEGERVEQALHGYDANGAPLDFSLLSGPTYVSVMTPAAGAGQADGLIRLEPGFADAGLDTAVIAVSDGVNSDRRQVFITVTDSNAPPPPPAFPFAAPFLTMDVGLTPHTVTAGDLNHDGIVDLAIANMGANSISIMLGAGDGTFGPRTDYPTAAMPHTVAIRDLNGDKIPDLANTNMGANSIGIMLGKGDGTFLPRVDYPIAGSPMILHIEDLNHDGAPDIALSNQTGKSVTVLLNKGDGSFPAYRDFATGLHPHGMDIADVNRDGNSDLIVANDQSGTISVLLGLGDGNFGSKIDYVTSSPHIVVMGDVNGDGAPDMAVANFASGTLSLLLCDADGTFRHTADFATGSGAHGVAIGDLNGDGFADLAVANQIANTLTLIPGLGGGAFGRMIDFPMGAGAHSISIRDLNRDGAPDIAVSSIFSNTVTILMNRTPAPRTLAARAFLGGEHEAIHVRGEERDPIDVLIEPINGTFDALDIDARTVVMFLPGSPGSPKISAVPRKTLRASDRDRNGVREVTVRFQLEELSALLGDVRGRKEVLVTVAGKIRSGELFTAPLSLTVVGKKVHHKPRVSPNPLNPSAVLSFTTSSPGRVRILIFNAQGRMVRSLLDDPRMPEGEHEVRMDGRDSRGSTLPTGIYFYRIESDQTAAGGQFTILK